MGIATDLQREVAAELDADPAVDAADIGVSVRDGVVTLTGEVRSYAEKFAAERAVSRVPGVVDVIDELKVRIGREDGRAEPAPAEAREPRGSGVRHRGANEPRREGAGAMQIAPQIGFRDFEPGEELRDFVEGQVSKLDHFYPGVIGCRVIVEIPHRRHERGNLYHVRIDCTVPGRELVVSRDPAEDHTHEDPFVAVVDAFDALCRQLEDHAREVRGDVKHHEPPPHGRVARMFPDEGYGFIESADGREVYFHENSVLGGTFAELRVGSEVRFAEEEGIEGPQASTVRPVGKHHVQG